MVNNLKAKPPKTINDLRHMVKSSADCFGDKILYYYIENNQKKEFSYNRLYDDMNALGTAFSRLGIMGKTVAVIGDNHPAYITTYLATVNGGGVIVPLDKELDLDQVVGFINNSEAEAIVYTGCMNNRIAGRINDMPNVKYLIPINFDGEGIITKLTYPYSDLLDIGRSELDSGNTTYLDVELDMDKMCAIIFTSGTTGTSKGVMLSQKNLTAAINSSCMSMSYDDENTFVSVLPPHHTYEMTCCEFGVINLGATIFINDSLKHVMKNFASFKPNALVLVPLFLETMHKKIWDEIRRQGMESKVRLAMKLNAAMLDLGIDIRQKLFGRITAAFGGNLKSIVCGGAPINPDIIKDFYHFGITVLEGYGITECAPLVAVNSPGRVKFHSVGTPVYRCNVKIDYAPGQDTGEILVKGDNVMLGYYKNEEATKAVFTEDGYFRTGDIGYIDDQGYIFITGRLKNVIILSNGKNIFPEELEEYISSIDFIRESVVVGRKNSNGEIVITAIAVPDMEHPTLYGKTPVEVYNEVKNAIMVMNKRLPSFKHIAEVEIRYEEFEKNTSKKIKRYKVK